jgi:hypothetical protein
VVSFHSDAVLETHIVEDPIIFSPTLVVLEELLYIYFKPSRISSPIVGKIMHTNIGRNSYKLALFNFFLEDL